LVLGLLTVAELATVPMWAEATRRIRLKYTALDDNELRRAVVHELVDWQVFDLLATTREQIAASGVASAVEVRSAPPLARHSSEVSELKRQFEAVLKDRVYRHPQVLRLREQVQRQLRQAFEYYNTAPEKLPTEFQERILIDGAPRAVADYLACMTDRAAFSEFERLFGGN
jgi:dGTPase